MARIRTIKPGFFRNEELFDAEQATGLPLRVAFAGLWTIADREGRFHWRPRSIKPDVLPYDEVDFAAVLDGLADAGLIVKYEAGGETYGHIPTFTTHQHVNSREVASEIPAPDEDSASTCTHPPEPVQGQGEQEQEQEQEQIKTTPPPQASGGVVDPPSDNIPSVLDRRAYPEGFEALWAIYRPIAAKNATKVDACHAWVALSTAEQADCATGLRAYVSWLIAERRERSATPAKHLATFIDRRGWEPFLEAETATGETKWVPDTDPRWPDLAARFEREKQRPLLPMSSKHQSGMGCYFRSDWLEGQEKAA